MPRYSCVISYDGGKFCGWQTQPNGVTVQESLERVLSLLNGSPVKATGAGRTDAGVHARGMVCHFDCQTRIPPERLAYALNFALPRDVRVKQSERAADGFHARFHATGKVYRYLIYNSPHASALGCRYSAHVSAPLDERLMDSEAQALIGRHDFAAFAASGSVAKDTVREMYRASVTRRGPRVMLLVHGGGFLYNMVRILAGTLIEVGAGKRAPGAIERAISSGNRLDLGITAPPQGLTLMRVFYGDDEQAAGIFGDPDAMLW